MGRIRLGEIECFIVNGEIVCWECMEEDEFNNLKESDIIMHQSIDDDEEMVFCERRKERV